MGKMIWVDWGFLMFRAIFMWEKLRKVSPTYTCLNMLQSNIRKVGLDEDDIVIIAVDSPKGSWRKEIDPAYKANRKAKRAEHDIDWKKIFADFTDVLENLEMNTPFHVLRGHKLEADDIIAYGCRKFKDKECVIISSDSDYEQLYAFGNVKVFSPISKKYKEVKNPYQLLEKKIQKEPADNLITPIITQEDYNRRRTIVNLMELPEHIDLVIDEKLIDLPSKEWDFENIAFKKSLGPRFMNIYDKTNMVKVIEKESDKKKKKKVKRKKKLKQVEIF